MNTTGFGRFGTIAVSTLLAFSHGAAEAGAGREILLSAGGPDKGAFLGIQIEEETDHPEGGARVVYVEPDSPAEQAGIAEGDVIVRLDETTIRGPLALSKQIRSREVGERVSVTVVRDGEERSLEAQLGERARAKAHFRLPEHGLRLEGLDALRLPDLDLDEEWKEKLRFNLENLHGKLRGLDIDVCDGGDCRHYDLRGRGRPRLGVQLVEVTPELGSHLGGERREGVVVSKVLPDSPAAVAGIEVGDLFVAVGDDEVTGVSELRRALRDREGESFDVELIRDRRPVRVRVTIPSRETDEAPSGPRAGAGAPPSRASANLRKL